MIVLDCETEAIVGNPLVDPPAFCGLAYDIPGHPPGYLHFRGEKSNARWDDVANFIHQCWDSGEPLLFHNAPFDLSVICREFLIPLPEWDRIHDTVYLVYLSDPYAQSLSLKPSAERYLGLPPDEKDELGDWLVEHGVCKRKDVGAHIVDAPLELISKYAIGDVVRTRQLYDYLYPKVPTEPYDRERRLMPILLHGTKRGVRVNRPALEEATEQAVSALDTVTTRIQAYLQAPNLNPSSSAQLAAALDKAGVVKQWHHTEKGSRSVAKKVLSDTIGEGELLDLLTYHSSLETCIGTFMNNWLDMSAEDGRLHPEWNQVRSTENGKRYGTRTGRLSSSNPNFQNVPTAFTQKIPEGLPPLPFMRRFLLPEEHCVWLKRDWSAQEIRIAAHFEDGPLLAAFRENPDLDPHQMTKELILLLTNKDFDRKHVKITGFQTLYGGGAPAISLQVGCTLAEGAELKNAYFTASPGIRDLVKDCASIGRGGLAITTWGGRKYFKEVSLKHPDKDFSYKLINYLIQGSAADQTKECLCRWYDAKDDGTDFLATVHDELNISVPADIVKQEMQVLKDHMEAPLFDCPMRSEGFKGPNWHDIKEYM